MEKSKRTLGLTTTLTDMKLILPKLKFNSEEGTELYISKYLKPQVWPFIKENLSLLIRAEELVCTK